MPDVYQIIYQIMDFLSPFVRLCLAVLAIEVMLRLLRYLFWHRAEGLSLRGYFDFLIRGRRGDSESLAEDIKQLELAQQGLSDRLTALDGSPDTGQEQPPPKKLKTVEEKEKHRAHKEEKVASQSRKATPWQASFDAISQLYNDAVDNQSARQRFREVYETTRIGPSNAMARRRDPNIEPEFQTLSDGDYYAVPLRESSSNYYAVIPRFDLAFQESSYGPGAMNWVFDCPDFNPQKRYSHVRVIRPALFMPDTGNSWTRKGRGELNLGQGE
jgi:hypothetical protein